MTAVRIGTSVEARLGPSRISRDNMIAPAWVLVAGDFHPAGGMDRANAELARYLCATRVPLHLVTHRVDADLADHPNVHVHLAR
jgi:hypothetical protein